MTFRGLQKIAAGAKEYPWKKFPFRVPTMQPPSEENTLPLEVAVLCVECDVVFDERVGRCPKCAESSDRALKLISVLNRVPKEEN